jgi:hypothetical protein
MLMGDNQSWQRSPCLMMHNVLFELHVDPSARYFSGVVLILPYPHGLLRSCHLVFEMLVKQRQVDDMHVTEP